MTSYEELQASFINMEEDKAREITRTLLDKGEGAKKIMTDGLVPVQIRPPRP